MFRSVCFKHEVTEKSKAEQQSQPWARGKNLSRAPNVFNDLRAPKYRLPVQYDLAVKKLFISDPGALLYVQSGFGS